MKAKLIKYKQELITNYILKNENGDTFATTKYPFPSEMEYLANSKGIKLQRLSFENCQAIERGYDLDELADKANGYLYYDSKKEHKALAFDEGYNTGFKKAIELMGDKKFNKRDMISAYNDGKNFKDSVKSEDVEDYNFIQSLQQTEWDVEIEMEKVESYKDKMGNVRTEKTFPKLDTDGCLILKRI